MTPASYLDYHATTPVDPRVLEVMWPYFTERFGNPASRSHGAGREADRAVDTAREQVASLVGARAQDITFTSGATESNNLALKGTVSAHRSGGAPRIVTVATEHRSILDTCAALERAGCQVTRLSVRPDGLLDLAALERALRTPTLLVSVMAANNEIGVLHPMAEIAGVSHAAGALLHTDASQAAGKVPVDVTRWGVDLLSFTAHKLYGPKGIGALYVRPGALTLDPVLHGGGHERGLRPGTLNVPAIVGFGAAAALCVAEMDEEAARLTALRDQLLAGLLMAVPDLCINGSMAARLPQNLNISVPGVDPEMLGPVLDDLAVSTGSACSSGHDAPSHVLSALGLPEQLARASIRFGLGRWTSAEAIGYATERVTRAVLELRQLEAQFSRS